jgi:hypothetical protein
VDGGHGGTLAEPAPFDKKYFLFAADLEIRVMKNVTITLEEEVARWARIRAAELDTSMSRLVGEVLKEQMEAEKGYDTARRRYLSRKAAPISSGVSPTRRSP